MYKLSNLGSIYGILAPAICLLGMYYGLMLELEEEFARR